MKVLFAKLWIITMILVTLLSGLALVGGIAVFLINIVGWLPILAVFGLGAGMTILFRITAWADRILESNKSK